MPDFRSEMIRLAASMPKGSRDRKELLAVLTGKTAGVEHKFSGGMVVVLPKRTGSVTTDAAGNPSVGLKVTVLSRLPTKSYMRGIIHTTLTKGTAGPRNYWFTGSKGQEGLQGYREDDLIGIMSWAYQQDPGPFDRLF